MINRILESRIILGLKNFPAAAILGPRQAGKTTLAKMIKDRLPGDSFYLDLENPDDQALLTEPFKFLQVNTDKCVIIDEIQRRPDLFPILRTVIDQDRRPGRYIVLGSASPELLFMSSETLTGRIIYTELTPFLFGEIKNLKALNEHWLHGGFPEPFLIDDENFRYEWYRSFFLTYIERDFRILGLGALPSNLSRFFSMLAHIHGNVLNKSMLSKSLSLNQLTINNYLDYFRNAFLIRELPSWHFNIGKRLVKSPKVYIRDSGLLHYLLKIKNYNELLGHPVVGSSWEGYVIEQIISSLGERFDYYYYRTQDGTEADLILVEGNQTFATIEIKLSSSPKLTRGFLTAVKDLESEKNYIIVPEIRQAYSLSDKVEVVDLEKFLEQFSKVVK